MSHCSACLCVCIYLCVMYLPQMPIFISLNYIIYHVLHMYRYLFVVWMYPILSFHCRPLLSGAYFLFFVLSHARNVYGLYSFVSEYTFTFPLA